MKTPDFYHPEFEGKMIPPDQKEHFNRYVEEFSLDIEKLKDKVVLDVGSGSNPLFVSELLEEGVTQKAYAIDQEDFFAEFDHYLPEGREKYPREKVHKSPVKKHYIKAKVEALPIKPDSVDLVLMRAVIRPETDLTKVFEQIDIVLKPNGEFKIYPIFRDSEDRERLDEILSKLDSDKFEYEWREVDSYEAGGKRHYRDLLIVRKK